MFKTAPITDVKQKALICESILRALPNWFGVEDSIINYIKETQRMPFIAVYKGDTTVGFVAIKQHNQYTAEVYVMGVLTDFHRQGIGKLLIEECIQYCRDNDLEFLTVKTLDKSRESESYAKTRYFYSAMGFKPLEVFKTLWDEHNPCVFMVKVV